MKEFTIRTISGIAFVFVIVSLVLAHEITFLILFLSILIFSLNEFYNLVYKLKYHPYKPFGIVLASILFIINFYIASGLLSIDYLWINLLGFFLLPVFPLFYNPKTFTQSWISTFSGWMYILLPLSLIPFIVFKNSEYDPKVILGVFVIIWIYDSLAYITGSLLGRHKMFPAISPKKSWEGFIGGMVLSIGASAIIAQFLDFYSPMQWAGFTLVIVISSTIGDFLESAIKRNAGVKDSGILMPGHGGFLDRFDSVLFSLPFVFLYYSFFLS